jgi:4-hydroxybenzoate polyprenyltransferase
LRLKILRLMRIAKPLLLVMTPIGVCWGLVEAWRFHWWLALLMAVLVGIISVFTWMTVRRIRSERASP